MCKNYLAETIIGEVISENKSVIELGGNCYNVESNFKEKALLADLA